MFLVQLIYASRADEQLSHHDMKQILADSRENNNATSTTGALLYNSQYFLQCLEGSRVAVNETYMRILGDARHSQPALLHYREISQRDFAQWNMGYVGEGISKRETFLRYSAHTGFDPFTLSGDSARQLLLDLAEQGASG